MRKPWCVGSESLGTAPAERSQPGAKASAKPPSPSLKPPRLQVTTRPLAAEADGEAGDFRFLCDDGDGDVDDFKMVGTMGEQGYGGGYSLKHGRLQAVVVLVATSRRV